VREAAKKGQLSLLYIYDSGDDAKRIATFEETLFKNESLALALKPYRCLKLDAAKDSIAKERFGRAVPYFIAFDVKGEAAADVSLRGYKSSTKSVLGILVKASRGHGKMPLMTFVKNYRTFLNDLDKLEDRKETLAKKKARLEQAGPRARSKLREVEKEAEAVAADEAKLLATEKRLLEAVKAPPAARTAGAVAVAAKP
jgi:hypothetical protein